MSKQATVRARIEPELKETVETLFQQLGLTTTEAITLFYKQVALHQGLPFAVKIPNKTTQQTFKDTEAGKDLVECRDAEELFEKLGM